MSTKHSRRQFLKNSSTLTAGVALVSGLTLPPAVHAAGSDEIKVGLIGIGRRGSGAIRDRAQVGDNFKIIAVADAFENAGKIGADALRNEADKEDNKLFKKVDLPDDRVFSGLDAYKNVIASLNPGDQILITTPPGFRPYHYRAAVEKGLHVFMEKPVCIDAPGFRHVMETNKMAEEKGLKVRVGFQRHAEPQYYNWIEQLHGGKIGDIQFTRIYWNGGPFWCRPREPGESELSFQIRNWYHFVWLCGDNVVEQHAHNIDIGNWIHSKGDRMAHPIEANAQGGRTHKAGPEELLRQAPSFSDRKAWDEWYQKNKTSFSQHGQAWDHFTVEFTYADGSKMFSQSRRGKDVWQHVAEYAHGTNGTGTPGSIEDRAGKVLWKNEEKVPKGPYRWEHDLLVKAIREDKPLHDGYSAAMSCMTAILGREAAFSGKVLKWDELVEKGRLYSPNGEITGFDQTAPVQPDADGFYESTAAVPGTYNPFTG